MLSNEYSYWVILGLVLVAFMMALAPLIFSSFIRPNKPSAIKQATYECGIESEGDSWIQFKPQYYIYALAFVIFDLETVLLLPVAVALKHVGIFAFIEMAIFLLILFAGLVWEWQKGILDWK